MKSFCLQCSFALPEGSKFCPNCGFKVVTPEWESGQMQVHFCPYCGKKTVVGKFCVNCGNPQPIKIEDIPREKQLFCYSCGSKNIKGYSYCVSCGEHLLMPPTPPEQEPVSRTVPPPSPPPTTPVPKEEIPGIESMKPISIEIPPSAPPPTVPPIVSQEKKPKSRNKFWKISAIIFSMFVIVIAGYFAYHKIIKQKQPQPVPPISKLGRLIVSPPSGLTIDQILIDNINYGYKINKDTSYQVEADIEHTIIAKIYPLTDFSSVIKVKGDEESKVICKFNYGILKIIQDDPMLRAAKVTIKNIGEYILNNKSQFVLPPGSYQISFNLQGYSDTTSVVQLDNFAVKEYRYLPNPAKDQSYLAIISSTVNDALVKVDGGGGWLTSTADTLVIPVNPGSHTCSITHNDYKTWSQDFNIQKGKKTILKYLPDKATGFILIAGNNASGASIFIDSDTKEWPTKLVDTLSIEKSEGGHTIIARKSEFKDWTHTVNVVKNQMKTVPTINLVPKEILVYITNPLNVAGAIVKLPDKGATLGPLTNDTSSFDLPEGEYTVLIQHPQYEDFKKTINFTRIKQRTFLPYQPSRKEIELIIRSMVGGAKGILTDYQNGRQDFEVETPLTKINAPWGPATIKITNQPQYDDFDTTLTLSFNKVDTLIYSPIEKTGELVIVTPYINSSTLAPYIKVYAQDRELQYKCEKSDLLLKRVPIGMDNQEIKLVFHQGEYEVTFSKKVRVKPKFSDQDITRLEYAGMKYILIQSIPPNCEVYAGPTLTTSKCSGKTPQVLLYDSRIEIMVSDPTGAHSETYKNITENIIKKVNFPSDPTIIPLYQQARNKYEEALNPNNFDKRQSLLDQADNYCQQALNKMSDYPPANFIMGMILYEKFKEIIKTGINPSLINFKVEQANSYLQKAIDNGLDDDYDTFTAKISKGDLAFTVGKISNLTSGDAMKWLEKAIRDYTECIEWMGNIDILPVIPVQDKIKKALIKDSPYVSRAKAAEMIYEFSKNPEARAQALKYWEDFEPTKIFDGIPPKPRVNPNEQLRLTTLNRLKSEQSQR